MIVKAADGELCHNNHKPVLLAFDSSELPAIAKITSDLSIVGNKSFLAFKLLSCNVENGRLINARTSIEQKLHSQPQRSGIGRIHPHGATGCSDILAGCARLQPWRSLTNLME
jgi:hypothetical protein